MKNIIIATIKNWNIKNFSQLKNELKNEFNLFLIDKKEELTYENISKIDPIYIFFPHWSWIIPKKIYKNYECIVFHMTDLPFGRGGSPLQNLISREIYKTKISALKVDEELDAGAIYMKKDLDISIGSAEEIYINLSRIIFKEMIPYILDNAPIPKKQNGKIVKFQRRTPTDSNILKLETYTLNKIYDFVRMLDAEGYPKAYIKLNSLKIELSEIHLKNNKLVGKFEVKIDE